MAYMRVVSKSDSHLRLLREPSFLSKGIFIGFWVGVLGILLFGSESCLLKLVIGTFALFLSCFMIDHYEICEIDKNLSILRLIRLHWCVHALENIGIHFSHPYVTIKLEDIQDVLVQEQEGTPIGKAFQVVFILSSGIKLGATEVFTSNTYREHSDTAEIIRKFLNLPDIAKSQDGIDYEGDGSSSSGDDLEMEGFEEISRADIKELEEELSKASQGTDCIENVVPDTSNSDAAAAASAIDENVESTYQGLEENATSS